VKDSEPQRRVRIDLPISERRLLLAFGDLVAVNAAVLLALRIWSIVGDRQFAWPLQPGQAIWFPVLSALWLILAAANDYYDLALTSRWAHSQGRLLQITAQLVAIYLLIFFLSPRDALPRLFILYYAVLSYFFIALWRMGRIFLIGWQQTIRPIVIVGEGAAAEAVVEAIRIHAPHDYHVVGLIGMGKRPVGNGLEDIPLLGGPADLLEFVTTQRIAEVVLATGEQADGELFRAVMACYERGISIVQMPILYEQLTSMVPIEYVGGQWDIILPLQARSPFDPYPLVKRGVDLVLSLLGLVLFGILLPFLALTIVLDSPGPVFYRQERVGMGGHPFWLLKLRTMGRMAEAESGPQWAERDDPRATRVGRFLRRSRLDEAPQLLNVLRGEMSLIGPRPERPVFVAQLEEQIPFYRARLAIRPGLSGWAQVNYHYGSSVEDHLIKLKYDLYYIRHCSVPLDLLILVRTVGNIAQMSGQ
jgi:exopolysaccharide biosynthesis polyprenyl glycosylphosphotransferase